MSEKARGRRLDQLLVERGLAESRSRAQALVAAGLVLAAGRVAIRPSQTLEAETCLTVLGRDHPWVSRGGVKLAAALDHFEIDPTGAVALDIGASTGGFTDVLLSRGAIRVYAVDVGHGQLAAKLRCDRRVVSLEGLNARALSRAEIPEPISVISCDVSFIGLETSLPAPLALAAAQAWLVALIKPQFEAGPHAIGKGGVVRDPQLQAAICARLEDFLARQPGWSVIGVMPSPIAGRGGNREFLLAGRRSV
jgi:23S rRNA (cytidine1920-2'-O)/16S rRNA (cytidine1409-2'-O)-methyltransferase